DKCITLAAMDSRQMCPGALFIAVKGERADGHDFLDDVFAKLENPKTAKGLY
ncbi:MAG: hypothetical protein IIZ73_04290, partial [Ruminococcus sp.]|nr:hypothetical protein [Ruminococcus sp.]